MFFGLLCDTNSHFYVTEVYGIFRADGLGSNIPNGLSSRLAAPQ